MDTAITYLVEQLKQKDKEIVSLKAELSRKDEELRNLQASYTGDKPVAKKQVAKKQVAKKSRPRYNGTFEKASDSLEVPVDFTYCSARVGINTRTWRVCGCKNNSPMNQFYCDKHQKQFIEKGWLRDGDSLVTGKGAAGTYQRFGPQHTNWVEKPNSEFTGEFVDRRPSMIPKMYRIDSVGLFNGIETTENDITDNAKVTWKHMENGLWVPYDVPSL